MELRQREPRGRPRPGAFGLRSRRARTAVPDPADHPVTVEVEDEAIRLVSARKANRRERIEHEA